MVLLKAVRHKDPIESFIEFPGMVVVTGLLVLIQHDRMVLIELPGPVDPHIAGRSCRAPVMDHFDRGLVCLVDMAGKELGLQAFIYH